jgi:hypothetical protein
VVLLINGTHKEKNEYYLDLVSAEIAHPRTYLVWVRGKKKKKRKTG